MNRATEITQMQNDLAGHWTEPVLEFLKAGGYRPISIDLELQAWHVVKEVLRAELGWRQALRLPTLVTLRALMERVLYRAAVLLRRRTAPKSVASDFEIQVRRLAAERRATPMERDLYAQIIGQPALHAAFKPPSRSDFVPRLRLTAAGR